MSNIEIVSWNPFATWIYKSSTTECSICREQLVNKCINCSTENDDKTCNVSKGNCGHCFHEHCIVKWMSTASNCPICTLPIHIVVKNMNNKQEHKKLSKITGSDKK